VELLPLLAGAMSGPKLLPDSEADDRQLCTRVHSYRTLSLQPDSRAIVMTEAEAEKT